MSQIAVKMNTEQIIHRTPGMKRRETIDEHRLKRINIDRVSPLDRLRTGLSPEAKRSFLCASS